MRLKSIIASICIFCIRGLRPLLGPATCNYSVTCSKYAILQIQEQSLHIAIPLIIKRIWSCRPQLFAK